MYQKVKSKYSPLQTQEWTVAAMVVLSESQEALTCEQIRMSDLGLVDVTPQKMSRILATLAEDGFIVKSKGKDGKMRYKSVGVLLEQGYNLKTMVF